MNKKFLLGISLLVLCSCNIPEQSSSSIPNGSSNVFTSSSQESTENIISSDISVSNSSIITNISSLTNESNIVSVVEDLISDGIYIDAIYLDNNLNEESKEVQINQAEYNKSVYLNDEEKVNVLIESSFKARVIVSLYCDGVFQIFKISTFKD